MIGAKQWFGWIGGAYATAPTVARALQGESRVIGNEQIEFDPR